MTICVSVKVSEGLVLAADSTASVTGILQGPDSTISQGILKTYDHARKLSHIKDYPIGTLSWGAALIGNRSVESLIKEYEYSLPSLQEEHEKSRMKRLQGGEDPGPFHYSVHDIATGLKDHFASFYNDCFGDIERNQRPSLGIMISGYSTGQYFSEQWLLDMPSETLSPLRPDVDGNPQFGADWYGLTDAIIRLHWGRDDQILNMLVDRFGISPEESRDLLSAVQYPILFDGMPLQDAIDYAIYLVNVVIGRFRFVVGAPLCGGDIDVAVITPTDFTWINRKTWKARNSTNG